jgi:hypothetical protein
MNLLDEVNGYVWGLDAKGCVALQTIDSLSAKMRSYLQKDTGLAHIKRTEIPIDHEQARFEFLFREKPIVRAAGVRVKLRQQMARELALLAFKKHPSTLYVTCDYHRYVVTVVRDGVPTGISGTTRGEEPLDVKLFQCATTGLVAQCLTMLNVPDPGRKVTTVAEPRESPPMEL